MKFFKIFSPLFVLAIFAFATCILGCKKKELNFRFKFTLANKLDGSNLSDATIKIAGADGQNLGKETFLSLSKQTNSQGIVEFSFKRGNPQNVLVTIQKDGFFKDTTTLLFDDLKSNEVNEIGLKLDQKGYVQIEFHNLFPLVTDEFKLFFFGSNTACIECAPPGSAIYPGVQDQTLLYVAKAGSTFKFDWFVNSNEEFGTETYEIIGGQTISFLKNY